MSWFLLGGSVVCAFCQGIWGAGEPYLEHFTSTRTQIVLQWKLPESGIPIGYELERSLTPDFSGAVPIFLPPDSAVYSDTGLSPDDEYRFSTTTLELGVTYHYRIRAQYESSWSDYSNTVSACLQAPVRGVPGDLFADIVLGQPDFTQNSPGATGPDSLNIGGGILIDRTTTPERAYFVDTLNNRILGFDNIHEWPLLPDIVLGQADFYSSAPNHEGTMQMYPDLRPPSASTLAMTHPYALSVHEAVLTSQMAVDASGALYVCDPSNHRVLKYEDPFATDTIADEVWGQPGFTTREENYGGISASSIRFLTWARGLGLTIDSGGSLWVADSGNRRVLRFPYDSGSGTILKTADLVLGQPNFTTTSGSWYPVAIQVAPDGTVYIAEVGHLGSGDPSRIGVYEPPLSNGMPPTRELATYPTVRRPTALALDPLGRGLWVQNLWTDTKLLDLSSGPPIYTITTGEGRGMGVDRSGNLYLHSYRRTVNDGVYKYEAPYTSGTRIFVDRNVYSGRDFVRAKGVARFSDQLIVTECDRILIWNDADVVESFDHADGLWCPGLGPGQFDVQIGPDLRRLGSPTVDPKNRLWVFGYFKVGGVFGPRFRAFDYPLSHGSPVAKELNGTGIPLVDYGGYISVNNPYEWTNFDFTDGGDQMWIGDYHQNRVIRVNNLEGDDDPGRGPYIDVVLGQPDHVSTDPNQGGDIGADTLWMPRFVAVGPDGNVYVSDNGGEGGSNWRMLIFDRSLFPDDLDHVLYAPPATVVLGTGGDFTVPGCVDETCDPNEASFLESSGLMVCGMGSYNRLAERFPLIYLNPFENPRPQLALGDACAMPKFTYIDDQGNLYIADYGWSRVLIYKQPFLYLNQVLTGLDRLLWMAY